MLLQASFHILKYVLIYSSRDTTASRADAMMTVTYLSLWQSTVILKGLFSFWGTWIKKRYDREYHPCVLKVLMGDSNLCHLSHPINYFWFTILVGGKGNFKGFYLAFFTLIALTQWAKYSILDIPTAEYVNPKGYIWGLGKQFVGSKTQCTFSKMNFGHESIDYLAHVVPTL